MFREQRAKLQHRKRQDEISGFFNRSPQRIPRSSVEWLLRELCVELGYCLCPGARQSIIDDPPLTPETFTHTVMELEGIGSGDSLKFKEVFNRINKAFLRESQSDVSE
ncbi:MAG: hypothetical protein AAFW84_15655 [Cyanobacteria bacterium J06635_15]